MVVQGAAGGFETAQVVAARKGLWGGDDALGGGQLGGGGMAEDEVVWNKFGFQAEEVVGQVGDVLPDSGFAVVGQGQVEGLGGGFQTA